MSRRAAQQQRQKNAPQLISLERIMYTVQQRKKKPISIMNNWLIVVSHSVSLLSLHGNNNKNAPFCKCNCINEHCFNIICIQCILYIICIVCQFVYTCSAQIVRTTAVAKRAEREEQRKSWNCKFNRKSPPNQTSIRLSAPETNTHSYKETPDEFFGMGSICIRYEVVLIVNTAFAIPALQPHLMKSLATQLRQQQQNKLRITETATTTTTICPRQFTWCIRNLPMELLAQQTKPKSPRNARTNETDIHIFTFINGWYLLFRSLHSILH